MKTNGKRQRLVGWLAALLVSVIASIPAIAAETGGAQSPEMPQRAAWTASRIQGSPDPPLPYVTEVAFPRLTFRNCLDMAAMPDSDRLFVAEQSGRIYSFIDSPARELVETMDLAIDLQQSIPDARDCFAITFDPEFAVHRYVYVCYVEAPDRPLGTHVARFRVSQSDPPLIEADSEQTIIRWRSGGHNGCCLKFGPDGLLYISAGDAGPANPPDPLRAGQDLQNVLSTIMRVDVRGDDFPDDAQRNYRIPRDNPFVDQDGARGEIWAYGLRNPWRMSFDRATGDLWVGDVGWELWEMLNRVERGGNYGWAIVEGYQPVHPEWPTGPTTILPPTITHPHSESSSITDGLTYYGSRLPELAGAHIYGDFDTGKLWSFRWQDDRVIDHREIADTTLRIVGFGETRTGEFLLLDHAGGQLHRLIPNPQRDQTNRFPQRLSETGLFAKLDARQPEPAAGVFPYSINAEPWSDQASAQRWLAIPGADSVHTNRPQWQYPANTVLAKTLSLEMERGNPASQRPIETQLLHYNGIDWNPYTYRWNEAATDADLVPAKGDVRELRIIDRQSAGGERRQTWHFVGRAECQRCHNLWSGPPLGFNFAQLDRSLDSESNQLQWLVAQQLITDLPDDSHHRPLPNHDDPTADLSQRARAYLHVNCAHCHRMHAGSAVLSKMPFELPLADTEMLEVRPTQGTFGIPRAKVIAAGVPYRSVLWYRMAKLGRGRMPHIGSSEVDVAGLQLIHDWIEQLPSLAPEAVARATSANGSQAETSIGESTTDELATDTSPAHVSPTSSPDWLRQLGESATEAIDGEQLARHLDSPEQALRLLHAIDANRLPSTVSQTVLPHAWGHADPLIRNLFVRFLPADQRQLLPTAIDPDQVLAAAGDPMRGAELFFHATSLQCRNCHRVTLETTVGIVPESIDLGPNLAGLGAKYRRERLLQSLLEPSREIAPEYVPYLVEVSDGRVLSGLLVSKTESTVVIKDAQGRRTQVDRDDVERLVPQRVSLMPEGQLDDLTLQQVADLLAFLQSLK